MVLGLLVLALVGAGVLAPDSGVVTKRLGLSRSEERILEQERQRTAGASVIDALVAQAPPEDPDVRDFDGGDA